MKKERLITIMTTIIFFALFPALIFMQVRVFRLIPNFAFLFIIADIVLVGFVFVEIFLEYRKWRKEKEESEERKEMQNDFGTSIEIVEDWDRENKTEKEMEKEL